MTQSQRLVILADDLTGAADSAARGWQAGLRANIFVAPPTAPPPPGLLALSTDSRHLDPPQAAAAVRLAIQPLAVQPGTRWYKKIDSTLRGNIGTELDALLDTIDVDPAQACALISPAFPAQARGLRNGFLVHADTPSDAISLPARLAAQSRRPVALIELETVRSDRLAAALAAAYADGGRLLVADAMSEADLAQLAATAEQALPQAHLCGSAGLVGVLAARMAAQRKATAHLHAKLHARTVLVVAGSGSAMARSQIDALREQGGVHAIEMAEDGSERVAGTAADEARCWLLCLPRPAPEVQLDGPTARRLAARLADRAMTLMQAVRPDALILTGGDTAVHVLTRLGVSRLEVCAELLPGMPAARAVIAEAHGALENPVGNPHPDATRAGVARLSAGDARRAALMVLKAGNHGDAQTLVTLMAQLLSAGVAS